jgi:hypothetical protein
MSQTLKQIIAEFLNTVQSINGTFYDAIRGFSLCQDHLTKVQTENLDVIRAQNPEHASIEFLDTQDVMYADGWPEDPAFRPLHMTTMKHFKARNAPDGDNARLMANLCLVAIYQWWEERFRPNIAEFMARDPKEILCPVMGDLRLIRISIIHGKGRAKPNIKNCQILQWFREGDEIIITQALFREMIIQIYRAMDYLYEDLMTIKA